MFLNSNLAIFLMIFWLHSDILWGFVSVSSLLEYIKQFRVHFQEDEIP